MPSEISGRRVEAIRKRALRFFNAEHYELVFVSNATSAIKLVVDCYRDYAAAKHTPFWYGYHKDAHTSLVGGRESAKTHRCFGSDVEVDGWIDSREQDWDLGLFAFPGQSNMTGRRLPLSWYVGNYPLRCDHMLTSLDSGHSVSEDPSVKTQLTLCSMPQHLLRLHNLTYHMAQALTS